MAKLPSNLYREWLLRQVNVSVYWYGTSYDACTVAKLQEKTRQFPQHYTADRMARYQADIDAGKIAGDCVGGAIKGAAWTKLGTQKKQRGRYNCPDKSADGMFEYCKAQGVEWGDISTLPELPCVAVRKAGHVGMYVGGGKVVEWEGFDYGCVMTDLSKRPWTHWYKLPWVDYSDTSGGTTKPSAKPTPPENTNKPTTGEGTLPVWTVKGTKWRIREKPVNGKILGYVSEPTQLTIYGEKDGWVAIKGGGFKGYISKDAFK